MRVIMLKFSHSDIEQIINELDQLIDELYDDLDTCELLKEEVQEITKGEQLKSMVIIRVI